MTWCQNHAPNLAKKDLVEVIKKEKIKKRKKKIKVVIMNPFLCLKRLDSRS